MYYAEIENKGMLGAKATWKEVKTEAQWKRIKKNAAGKAKEAYLWDETKTHILDGITYETKPF